MSGAGKPGDERLRRRHRMSRPKEFRRAYSRGRRRRGRLANLHVHPGGHLDPGGTEDSSEARLGITASRKVGNAVSRHRLKRRVREIFRRHPERSSLAGLDLVIHLLPAAAKADFQALRDEIDEHFRAATDAGKRSPAEGGPAERGPADRSPADRSPAQGGPAER